jgi:hypothetical protein
VLQETLPKGWISSPADPSHTCENPPGSAARPCDRRLHPDADTTR